MNLLAEKKRKISSALHLGNETGRGPVLQTLGMIREMPSVTMKTIRKRPSASYLGNDTGKAQCYITWKCTGKGPELHNFRMIRERLSAIDPGYET
ncbi:hypothetical protein PoB_001517600 [Plakobranchus ocellatus]|uniref:Uncharacterized protein n=1 Tax=Plakobranchus ocellatus TaxID=259542 RepID=A0AAV3YN50_9GAST|nr:hypothetical protein PoB_001517600 [Plakobranchus ocellatus]